MTKVLSITQGFAIEAQNRVWTSAPDAVCSVVRKDGTKIPFDQAACTVRPYRTGVGQGWEAVYADFPGLEGLVLKCRMWAEDATGDVLCEVIPLSDAPIGEIQWPAAFANPADDAYTVLPLMQGAVIPNHTELEFPDIWPTGSQYTNTRYTCTPAMYMQFFGQYDADGGCMTIFETRYDGGMTISAGHGKDVTVAPRWIESLGSVGYARRMRLRFFAAGADYNDIALAYREYIRSIGELITLRQKAAANPKVAALIGRPIVHTNGWYHTQPDSWLYDTEHPEKNDILRTFDEVAEDLRTLKARGVEEAVLHLDGWGHRGYDNEHPDYLPPSEQCGGWDGMKRLADTCHGLGYFFGTHDQYRDYYLDAPTFDENQAVRNEDGGMTVHARWLGGKQTYLCATQAPYYVRRNFTALREHGILLDNTYLDVFSCVELDECFHPDHLMTRQQCAEGRMQCFRECARDGILVQSEQGIDWAFPGLVFVHFAPFAPDKDWDSTGYAGYPVPLLELVYHDCLMTPYLTSENTRPDTPRTDSELFGLLCGGATYVGLHASEEDLRRCAEVTAWQKEVQLRPMLRHEFVDGDHQRHRITFEGGYSAEIDLRARTYALHRP